MKGLAGTNAYLYLQSIDISPKKPPEARVEFEQKLKGGSIKRIVRKLKKGDNLFDLSEGLDQYREGYVVSDINAVTDTISFTNGVELNTGDAIGNVNEAALRRIQIRETIKAHFDKEQALFQQGIKVLSLFFIDEVVKYRDYSQQDEKGEYAHIFEEEYSLYLNEVLGLGLGHMAVKLAVGLGAHVTVLSRSTSKAADALALGADRLLDTSDAGAMAAAASGFDLIIDTIPVKHDLNPYIPLLDIDGTLVLVGQLGSMDELFTVPAIMGRRRIAGSMIGGIPETQEMLDFCARKNILPDCEMIRMDQINEAFERMERSDVRYRFVIDMGSLEATG